MAEQRQGLTIKQLLSEGVALLENWSETAALDARILLEHVVGMTHAELIIRDQEPVAEAQKRAYLELLARRAKGEPVAYLIGEKEFWSLPFMVTPATLIPRPETELLVQYLIEHLAHGCRVVDLGTGSGAIAIALAKSRPDLEVWATDLSEAALAVAKANGERHGVRVHWRLSDWGAALTGIVFDAIVSNPPYIAESDRHLQQPALQYEPRNALVSGEDGLDDIRKIVRYAEGALTPGGVLVLEHGYQQGPAVKELMTKAGFCQPQVLYDLAGLWRATCGCRPTAEERSDSNEKV
ncbi:MAG: peptide chain release factor N(5)-glutamine methyltransferase [Gammaproteobacteria bacterium]|nr:MAG: peptide chain release factor N(5)-glutamine methyltransferase [Gammaproteobacteria bacterium]